MKGDKLFLIRHSETSWRVPHVEQEILTGPEYLTSLSLFAEVHDVFRSYCFLISSFWLSVRSLLFDNVLCVDAIIHFFYLQSIDPCFQQ